MPTPNNILNLYPYLFSLASGLLWGWVGYKVAVKRNLRHVQFWVAMGVFLGPFPLLFIGLARKNAHFDAGNEQEPSH